MARTVVGAKKFINLKGVMTVNALLLVVLGVALLAAALQLLVAYGFVPDSEIPSMGASDAVWAKVDWDELLPVKLATQTLGGTLIGLGFVVWAATLAVESAARTILTLTLALTHGLMALMFWANTLLYPSLLGWASVGVSAAFAVAYAVFFLSAAYRTETGNAVKANRTGHDSARRYSSPETSSQP